MLSLKDEPRSIRLLEQGMASPEDLDLAVKGSFGLRLEVIGALETMGVAGPDLMAKRGDGDVHKIIKFFSMGFL